MDHVRYIDRTRDDYLRQGYEKSYEWAHFAEVPFTPLKRPLSECRVGLLGTSEVAVEGNTSTAVQGGLAVFNQADPALVLSCSGNTVDGRGYSHGACGSAGIGVTGAWRSACSCAR